MENTETTRSPRIVDMSLSYAPKLVHIALYNTVPGAECSVIQQIRQRMQRERLDFSRHGNSATRNRDNPVDATRWNPSNGLFMNPIFGTLLGHFDLFCIYTAQGFSQCQVISTLMNVQTQQFIICTVPIPPPSWQDSMIGHNWIDQDPIGFLGQWELSDGSAAAKLTTGANRPILVVVQLQLSGIFSTFLREAYTFPVLHLVNTFIEEVRKSFDVRESDWDVTALVLDSQGWSDFCILFRSANIDHVTACISRVNSITIGDVFLAFDELEEHYIHANGMPEGGEFRKSLERRFEFLFRLLDKDAPSGVTASACNSSNHIFATVSKTVGFFWPFAADCLAYEIAGKTSESDFSLRKMEPGKILANYERWRVEGEVRGSVHYYAKPGHANEVAEIVKGCYRSDSKPDADGYIATAGLYELCYTFHDIVGSPADGPSRTFPLKDIIRQLYYVRWCLLQRPTCECDDPLLPYEPLPWLCWRSRSIRNETVPLTEIVSAIRCNLPLTVQTKNRVTYPVTLKYQDHTSRHFARRLLEEMDTRGYRKFKLKKISRFRRDALKDVLALWDGELRSVSNTSRMFELVGGFQTWERILRSVLDDEGASTSCVEEVIYSFVEPFNKAVVQRILASLSSSEMTDVTSEFKGGLAKLLTGLDNLMKGVTALVSDPENIGLLTIVTQKRTATIRTLKLQPSLSATYTSDVLAIVKINFAHMAHPVHLTTVVHEIVHLLTDSEDFKALLRKSELGNKMSMLIDEATATSLFAARLNEILVEFVTGYMLFAGEPELYSKVYLTQFSLNPLSFHHDEQTNLLSIVEHVTRCFFTTYAIETIGKGEASDLDTIVTQSQEWANSLAAYITDDDPTRSLVLRYVPKYVRLWLEGGMLEHLVVMQEAVSSYFSSFEQGCDDERWRAAFWRLLNDFRYVDGTGSKITPAIQRIERMLAGDDGSGSRPIHFAFREFGANDEHASPTLRQRFLESLVANVCLIRCFYAVFFGWLEERGGPIHLSRSDGLPLSDMLHLGQITLDAQNEAPFTVGHAGHERYTRLRVALIKSMSHLADITKYSELIYQLAKKEA